MPSLRDPLPDDTIQFLRVAADGHNAADGRWPYWQWVRQQLLTQHDLDAEEILRGMPTWKHNYRPAYAGNLGSPPESSDPVRLTVHGMTYVSPAVPSIQELVNAFLAALKIATIMQQGIRPRPTELVELKAPGDDFTRTVNMEARTSLSADQLFDVIKGEPATWRGAMRQNNLWTWDLTEVRLTPYTQVQTIDDYLARLDELVAIAQSPALPQYLPPMALPDAFDHLDLTWRIATGEHLFHVPRAAIPAKLTQPVASAEEFESRCSALADMLKSFTFPTEGGSLNNMKIRLSELLGDQAAGRAHAAVDTLRRIFDLRAGQQHHAADTRAEPAKTALGLTQFGSDWAAAWDHLRALVVQALTTIREEISPLTD